MKRMIAAAALGIFFALPANALPVTAHGSFGFAPIGSVTADTGDLTPATGSTTYAGAFVNVPSTGNLGVNFGDVVTPAPLTFGYAPGLGTEPTSLTLSVHGLTFEFDTVRTIFRASNFILAEWTGSLTGSAGGIFATGTPVDLSQSCDQSKNGAVINCSNGLVTVEIPEPASLGLLAAAIMGLAATRRRAV